jgi:hypothetical protein
MWKDNTRNVKAFSLHMKGAKIKAIPSNHLLGHPQTIDTTNVERHSLRIELKSRGLVFWDFYRF